MLAVVALEVKEGLARQAFLPVCRAEAAMQTTIRVSGYLIDWHEKSPCIHRGHKGILT
jgi:hypothetical protein